MGCEWLNSTSVHKFPPDCRMQFVIVTGTKDGECARSLDQTLRVFIKQLFTATIAQATAVKMGTIGWGKTISP